VVVAMNFTSATKTVTLDAAAAGVSGTMVKTLATDDASLQKVTSLQRITLPPYACWIGSVE